MLYVWNYEGAAVHTLGQLVGNICTEIMEFQRTGYCDLLYMKTKELGWNETQGIQSIGIEDSQGNRIVDQRQVLKIWENYITEPSIDLTDRKP